MRICDVCKERMQEGFVINSGEEYYCSEDCLHTEYTEEEYMEMYDEGNGDSYWTDWCNEDDEIGDESDDENKVIKINENSDAWRFVEEYYPDYYKDEKISLENDLIKILNNEYEDGDCTHKLFYEKYNLNYNLVEDAHSILLLEIYETAIKNFISNQNK